MLKFEYYSPTKIIFEDGAENRAGELVHWAGGSRVFVVYGGGSAKKSGLLDRVKKSLDDAGIASEYSGGVVPNPVLSTVRRMIKEAAAFKADFILAVGGGSVHDTAKAVAHGLANPDTDVWNFWCGTKVEKSTPVGSILTISAAGSETSNSSVITNDETDALTGTKRGMTTDFNRPKFTLMNPRLTMTLPKWQIGAGAADIFMHTDERYFTTLLGNGLTDEFAEGLFRDIVKYGPRGVQNPDDYEAMSEIMWCGSVSHIGLTGIGTKGDTNRDGDWGVHQLGMAISAIYDSTHGATLTAVWAAWAKYVMDANPARFARLGRNVFGISEKDDLAAAKKTIEAVNDFFKSLGMPLSLTELLGKKLSQKELEDLAQECSFAQKRTIGTFKSLAYDDILKIYTMAN